MQYSSKPLLGDNGQAYREQESDAGAASGVRRTSEQQSPAVHVHKEHVPGQSSETASKSLNHGDAQGHATEQARYESSSRDNTGSEGRHGVSGNAPLTHRPSWSSSAPSAGWSTLSPAASWRSSQTGDSAQVNQGSSSGQSLVQKAKEHLPGGSSKHANKSSEHANKSSTDGSSLGLMEKAKAHLPGSSSSGQGATGQGQRTTDRPDIPAGSQQDGSQSRLGAEPTVPGKGSNWESPAGTRHSTEHIETGSSQGGLSNTHSQEMNRFGGVTQHNSGLSTGNARAGASRSSETDGNAGHYNAGQSTGHSHHGHPGTASQGQRFDEQSGGFTQGYNQQGQAASPAAHVGNTNEPITELPSTGIPPVFHPPSYTTSKTPSHSIMGGGAISSNDSQGVNAKQALESLTDNQTGMQGRETSGVNAKQALDPLTYIAVGDSQEEVGGVHARQALQPLTEVPAQESNKGFVESIKEYLPGQQHTGIAEHSRQPGFLDKAMAYVPSLHSSGHSQPSEEWSATHKETAYPTGMPPEPLQSEAQPSLLDKAKAYIPVLGSSTEFDPATEGGIGQQDSLYRETPTGPAGLVPEQQARESLLDKAKAYVPGMGAPGTTAAGIDAETGGSAGSSHKGLVENLVEKAIEILPHQITGADPAPACTATSAAHPYASGEDARDVGPAIGGVRLSDKPILGPDAGPAPVATAAGAEAPGIFDRVKQLVGLGPASTKSADQYEASDAPSSPIIASQGINAGIMGTSGRCDARAIDDADDDAFEDAVEDPVSESFTSDAGAGAGTGQPYVSKPPPPVADTRNDPDETFGPLKHRDQSAQPGGSYEPDRGLATYGDDEEETPGKKGLRSRVKGKFGSKKEHHQEKKRNKADQELQHRMHEKEIPKAQPVTTPAAPGQGTKAPTAGSNMGSGGEGMGGVAGGGNPADPQGTAQSESKDEAEKPPAAAKTDNPHLAVKANDYASGSNVKMGAAAQQKAEEAPPKKSKSGFMSKLKKPFGRS